MKLAAITTTTLVIAAKQKSLKMKMIATIMRENEENMEEERMSEKN